MSQLANPELRHKNTLTFPLFWPLSKVAWWMTTTTISLYLKFHKGKIQLSKHLCLGGSVKLAVQVCFFNCVLLLNANILEVEKKKV